MRLLLVIIFFTVSINLYGQHDDSCSLERTSSVEQNIKDFLTALKDRYEGKATYNIVRLKLYVDSDSNTIMHFDDIITRDEYHYSYNYYGEIDNEIVIAKITDSSLEEILQPVGFKKYDCTDLVQKRIKEKLCCREPGRYLTRCEYYNTVDYAVYRCSTKLIQQNGWRILDIDALPRLDLNKFQ